MNLDDPTVSTRRRAVSQCLDNRATAARRVYELWEILRGRIEKPRRTLNVDIQRGCDLRICVWDMGSRTSLRYLKIVRGRLQYVRVIHDCA